jgi:hypothetical protein
MEKPKGGRGKQASYSSTHVRIPDILKERVEHLKELYFSGELEQHEETINRAMQLLQYAEQNLDLTETSVSSLNLKQAIGEAKKILKMKVSARDSLTKLLTALYNVKVTKEDLADGSNKEPS